MARTDRRRVLVCNPASGSEDHVEHVTALARERDIEVSLTESAGDATRLAREAAESGADLVAAAGGDGTVNEVANGLLAAGDDAETTLAVVPAGTGNNFAANVGVESLPGAFDVIDDGRRRRIDVGVANDRAFVNSCVGGITAEASASTSSDDKREFGVLAYVGRTLEAVASFDPPSVRVALGDDDGSPETTWEGDAMFVLVGNCRRFSGSRRVQANVEDGLFEVTIVEEASAIDLVEEAALEGLVGGDATHIVRRRTPALTVEARDGQGVTYSLDGEILETGRLSLETRQGALRVAVGDGYDPDPDR